MCALRLTLVATAIALSSACASRPLVLAPPDSSPAVEPLPDPEALLARGCFTCLERAFAVARERNLDAVAFEAAALLVLRTKELGMAPGRWGAAARDLAVGDPDRQAVMEIVEALPADPFSGADAVPEAQVRTRFRPDARLPHWLSLVEASHASSLLRLYLQLALTCASDRDTVATVATIAGTAPEPVRAAPLIQYRVGICSNAQADTLRTVRGTAADFVDADYALGRYAMQVRGYADVDEALRRLGSAAAAFPESPAIATVKGNIHQTLEAWPEALAAYDAALLLAPEHPDARLGRIVSLSHLGRHQEAIAAASQLVDAGRWFVGQALYWRAWNHFQLESYLTARADADRARQVLINSGVFLLSGAIDWRLGRLDTAEADFEESLRLDAGQCDAAIFLGGVRSEQRSPTDALTAFRRAVECYDGVIAERRAAADRLATNSAVPESHRVRETVRHERAIADAAQRRQEAREGIDRLEAYLTSNPPQSRPQPQ